MHAPHADREALLEESSYNTAGSKLLCEDLTEIVRIPCLAQAPTPARPSAAACRRAPASSSPASSAASAAWRCCGPASAWPAGAPAARRPARPRRAQSQKRCTCRPSWHRRSRRIHWCARALCSEEVRPAVTRSHSARLCDAMRARMQAAARGAAKGGAGAEISATAFGPPQARCVAPLHGYRAAGLDMRGQARHAAGRPARAGGPPGGSRERGAARGARAPAVLRGQHGGLEQRGRRRRRRGGAPAPAEPRSAAHRQLCGAAVTAWLRGSVAHQHCSCDTVLSLTG